MKNLVVHMNFNDNCEEAFNFYKNAIGGEIIAKQTYGDMPMPGMPVPDSQKSKILHIEYKFDDVLIMGADAMPDKTVTVGNNISISINIEDETEQAKIFGKLAEGGNVTMPLQDTFWNAKFGTLIDKYDVGWMLNCPKK